MAEFDPDAYLGSSSSTAVAEPDQQQFNPDAYLAQQPPTFDPDAYLKQKQDPYVADMMNAAPPEASYDASDVPDWANKLSSAVVDYVGKMVPTSRDALLRAANIPTDWKDPQQLAEFIAPSLKFAFDTGEQAKGRIEQIEAASKTPDWSQERYNAGVGTVLDLLTFAGIVHGAKARFGEISKVTKGGELNAEEKQQVSSETQPGPPSQAGPAEVVEPSPQSAAAEQAGPGSGEGGAQESARPGGAIAEASDQGTEGRSQGAPPPDRSGGTGAPAPEPGTGLAASGDTAAATSGVTDPASSAPGTVAETVPPQVDPAAVAAANVEAAPAMAEAAAKLSTSTDPGGFNSSPLIAFIKNDVGGILSKSAALDKWGPEKFAANKSLWDDAPSLRSPRHNSIYNSKTGVPPDQAATAAVDAGLLPQGATEADLWRAIQGESNGAHMMAGQQLAARRTEASGMRQYKAFTASAAKPIPGEKPLRGADLNVGDQVKIGTETMKVTDIDPDTYDVTLEDGSKYGIQHVANDQALFGRIEAPDPAILADKATREIPAGTPQQGAAFDLARPESVAEQEARLAAEGVRRSQREGIAEGLSRQLVGTTGDIGQGTLFGKEDIFGFGPGAASIGENLSAGSQIKQLTNLVSDALRTPKAQPMLTRWERVKNALGAKVVTAKQTVANGMANARAAWLTIKNGYLRPPVTGEFLDAIKDWQGADQRASFETRQFVRSLRREIRDPLVREAITNYIQADGDAALLQARAAKSNIKFRPGYEAALRLTDEQKTLAANVRQYFDAMLQDGINSGMIDGGLENYITQIWKRPNKFTNELTADLQSGKLQTSFNYARKRIFSSFFDGEQAGYEPATKDVSALVAAYDLSFKRSLSARGLVSALREAKTSGGEPVARFSGMTQPIPHGAEPPEAYLVRSKAMPETAVTADGRRYLPVDHPSLRGWKLVVQGDTDAPTYHQVDMLVHPDYAPQLRNILGNSAFRSGKLGAVVSPFLKTGAILKQTKLSLSVFHLDQEGLHGLFHRVNPANLEHIDFDDATQWRLVRNGLQVADYNAMELFSEGLRGGGLVAKVPVLGELQNGFNEWLFKDYIPRLKMTMALDAFDRNMKRYGGSLSPDSIAELTARQGNAAFGELNYKLMARNPSLQDFLRLTVLAPDFLEARSRFVGQALKPYGAEQRAALLLSGATMYVTARALNKWLDDDPHWELNKAFSVVYNGREYRLRSVLGDTAELATDWRRFFYNRFSPWLKLGVEAGTKRDYRGLKISNLDVAKDFLSWFVPIPAGSMDQRGALADVRSAFGGKVQPLVNRVLGSAGVSNKPAETPIDVLYKSALKFKEGLNDPRIQMEVNRAQQETYAGSDYSKINRALIDGDKERATEEIVNLLKQGKPPQTMIKFYSNFPLSPFTGSRMLDYRWLAQMAPDEKARYQNAIRQRTGMSQNFFKLWQNAYREAQKQ